MKKLLFALTILLLVSAKGYSQSPKFGYIDFVALYEMMPGKDSAQAVYEKYVRSLEQQFMAMQEELQMKYEDYQTNLDSYSNIIRQTKEKEMQDLQMRITQFQESIQQDMMEKESELAQPIINKAKAAIDVVAKENGYNYILNSSENLLLYTDGDDILPLVKKKLGLP